MKNILERITLRRFFGLEKISFFIIILGLLGLGELSLSEAGHHGDRTTFALLGAEDFPEPSSYLLAQEDSLTGDEPPEVPQTYRDHPEIKKFIRMMEEKHDFDPAALEDLFETIPYSYSERKKQQNFTNRAPERKADWAQYRRNFLTPVRIAGGVAFWMNHAETLQQVRNYYGVPEPIIVATLGMESFYGRRNGSLLVFKSLTILAAEGQSRNQFYFRELEHFLLFCRSNTYNPLTIKGSYSGAMGPAQFMPSSAVYYARDGDEDGRVDLLVNMIDNIRSIGNYYAACKWRPDQPIAKRHKNPPSDNWDSELHRYLKVQTKQEFSAFTGILKPPRPAPEGSTESPTLVEHWQLYPNYRSLKCYNNSHLYALTLYQLSAAIYHQYRSRTP